MYFFIKALHLFFYFNIKIGIERTDNLFSIHYTLKVFNTGVKKSDYLLLKKKFLPGYKNFKEDAKRTEITSNPLKTCIIVNKNF